MTEEKKIVTLKVKSLIFNVKQIKAWNCNQSTRFDFIPKIIIYLCQKENRILQGVLGG